MPGFEVVFLGPDEELAKVIDFGPGDIAGVGFFTFGRELLELVEHELAIERKGDPGEIVLLEVSMRICKNAILNILKFHPNLGSGFALKLTILSIVLGGEDEVELEVDVVGVQLREGFELHAELHEVIKWHCLVCVINPAYLSTLSRLLLNGRTCRLPLTRCGFSSCSACSYAGVGTRTEWRISIS